MTIDEMKNLKDIPVVIADEQGNITYINKEFESEYGWSMDEIMGQNITVMIPPEHQKAHEFGFARFIINEQPKMLDKTVTLQIIDKEKDIYEAEHYIIAEKIDDKWVFGATIVKDLERTLNK